MRLVSSQKRGYHLALKDREHQPSPHDDILCFINKSSIMRGRFITSVRMLHSRGVTMSLLKDKIKKTFLTKLNDIAISPKLQNFALTKYKDFKKSSPFVKEEAPQYGLSIYQAETQAYLLACIKYACDQTLATIKGSIVQDDLPTLLDNIVKPLCSGLVRQPNDYNENSANQTEQEAAMRYISLNATTQLKALSEPSLFTQVGAFFRENRDELTIGAAVAVTATAAAFAFRK